LLSGFCLFLSIATPDRFKNFSVCRFATKRFWRIVPAYYATIVLAALMWPLCHWLSQATQYHFRPDGDWPTGPSWILHGLLLHVLSPTATFDLNGPFWSLGLEWEFYICFPLMAWAFHKFGAIRSLTFITAGTLLYRAVMGHYLADASSWVNWTWISANIPGRAADFGIGMLAAWQLARGDFKPWKITKLAAFGFVCLLATVGGMKTAPFTVFNDLLWSIAYYCLLAAAVGGAPWLGRILSVKPMTWIGERSYSVYLIHLPLLVLVAPPLQSRLSGIPLFVALMAVMIPVSLSASAVWYWFFERPFLSGAPAWWPARRPAPALATQRLAVAAVDPAALPLSTMQAAE